MWPVLWPAHACLALDNCYKLYCIRDNAAHCYNLKWLNTTVLQVSKSFYNKIYSTEKLMAIFNLKLWITLHLDFENDSVVYKKKKIIAYYTRCSVCNVLTIKSKFNRLHQYNRYSVSFVNVEKGLSMRQQHVIVCNNIMYCRQGVINQ